MGLTKMVRKCPKCGFHDVQKVVGIFSVIDADEGEYSKWFRCPAELCTGALDVTMSYVPPSEAGKGGSVQHMPSSSLSGHMELEEGEGNRDTEGGNGGTEEGE